MFNREIDTWLWHSAKHCRDNVQLLTIMKGGSGQNYMVKGLRLSLGLITLRQ